MENTDEALEVGNEKQIASIYREAAANTSGAAVFDMAVDAIRLSHLLISANAVGAFFTYTLAIGLSSNPEHELAPPASFPLLLNDKAIYGVYVRRFAQANVTGSFIEGETRNIWLPNLIRPGRQILVWRHESAGATTMGFRIEAFYQPVELSPTDLETLNLKYGRFDRW